MSIFGDAFVKEVEESLGHNRRATDNAEDLLATFSRAPAELDADTVGRAITLTKQMKLAADELDRARKDDAAELRERLADLERPYRIAHEHLAQARREMLARLGTWLTKAGKRHWQNAFGLMAYQKESVGFEIEDAGQLPPQFTMTIPDTKAIERAIKVGDKVPGVRRVEKTSTIVV